MSTTTARLIDFGPPVAGRPGNLDRVTSVTPYDAHFTPTATDLLKDVAHGEEFVPSPQVLAFFQISVEAEYSPLQLEITDAFGPIVVSERQAMLDSSSTPPRDRAMM